MFFPCLSRITFNDIYFLSDRHHGVLSFKTIPQKHIIISNESAYENPDTINFNVVKFRNICVLEVSFFNEPITKSARENFYFLPKGNWRFLTGIAKHKSSLWRTRYCQNMFIHVHVHLLSPALRMIQNVQINIQLVVEVKKWFPQVSFNWKKFQFHFLSW